jgi:molecular chaperone Hsp33
VTLQFRAEGPLGGLVADADPEGNLRGYVHHPTLQFPLEDVQRLAHAGLGSRGVLNCVRQRGGHQVQGQVNLVTGGIDRDLEVLVHTSDGERGAFGLGVFLRPEPAAEGHAHHEGFGVAAAFGALLLALPDADPFAFDEVAARVRRVSDAPVVGDIREVLAGLAGDYPVELMEAGAVQFNCRCSTETVTGVLVAIGAVELKDMIRDPGHAEITCHFCNHTYRFEKEALQLLLDQSQPPIVGESLGEA